jgi:hypothetical protein
MSDELVRWRIRLDGADGGIQSYIVQGEQDDRTEAIVRALEHAKREHGEAWVFAADVTVEDLGPVTA